MRCEARVNLFECAAEELFVKFCELAGEDDGPVWRGLAEVFLEVFNGARDAVRRFVENNCFVEVAGFGGVAPTRQECLAAFFEWEEAVVPEVVHGKAGGDERSEER